MSTSQYIIIVQGRISTPQPKTEEALRRLNCYYSSPPFSWDGSLTSLDVIFDIHQTHFSHILDWSATVAPV